MTNNYAKAYTEVFEVLKYLSKEEYKKIPQEKIQFFKDNKDDDYNFIFNPNIDIAKQNISKEANAVLVTLFRDYFATERQKNILESLLIQNQGKLEKQKSEYYNTDNLFKKEGTI